MSKIMSKKKTLFIIMIIAALSAIIISQSVNQDSENVKVTSLEEDEDVIDVAPVASWVPIEGGESEEGMIESSQIIGTGKVLSQKLRVIEASADEYAMAFTISEVEIGELNALNEEYIDEIAENIENRKMIVEILQTGGTGEGVSTPEIEDAPLLEIGKEYLFFLAPGDDGLYIPVGGRLGYAEIINGKIAFVNNESKAMFADFEGILKGKFPSELEEVVEEKVETGSIVVNEDNQKPISFVEDIETEY
jgi:hypothetical protein